MLSNRELRSQKKLVKSEWESADRVDDLRINKLDSKTVPTEEKEFPSIGAQGAEKDMFGNRASITNNIKQETKDANDKFVFDSDLDDRKEETKTKDASVSRSLTPSDSRKNSPQRTDELSREKEDEAAMENIRVQYLSEIPQTLLERKTRVATLDLLLTDPNNSRLFAHLTSLYDLAMASLRRAIESKELTDRMIGLGGHKPSDSPMERLKLIQKIKEVKLDSFEPTKENIDNKITLSWLPQLHQYRQFKDLWPYAIQAALPTELDRQQFFREVIEKEVTWEETRLWLIRKYRTPLAQVQNLKLLTTINQSECGGSVSALKDQLENKANLSLHADEVIATLNGPVMTASILSRLNPDVSDELIPKLLESKYIERKGIWEARYLGDPCVTCKHQERDYTDGPFTQMFTLATSAEQVIQGRAELVASRTKDTKGSTTPRPVTKTVIPEKIITSNKTVIVDKLCMTCHVKFTPIVQTHTLCNTCVGKPKAMNKDKGTKGCVAKGCDGKDNTRLINTQHGSVHQGCANRLDGTPLCDECHVQHVGKMKAGGYFQKCYGCNTKQGAPQSPKKVGIMRNVDIVEVDEYSSYKRALNDNLYN